MSIVMTNNIYFEYRLIHLTIYSQNYVNFYNLERNKQRDGVNNF